MTLSNVILIVSAMYDRTLEKGFSRRNIFLTRVICAVAVFFLTPANLLAGHSSVSSPSRYPVVCDAESVSEVLAFWETFQKNKDLSASERERLETLFGKIPEGCLSEDVKADILAAFKWMRQLPCNLRDQKEQVEVVIQGELHGTRHTENSLFPLLEDIKNNVVNAKG